MVPFTAQLNSKTAGKGLILECMKLGGCKVGQAKLTCAYKFPARFGIHAVGGVAGRQKRIERATGELLPGIPVPYLGKRM